MSWHFHKQTRINKSPSEIYPFISTAEGFLQWFLRKCELDLKPGGRFHMWWAEGVEMDGEVIEAIPNERISFRWMEEDPNLRTRVDLWLEPKDDGSTVVHFEDGDFPEEAKYASAFASVNEGWMEGLMCLKARVQYQIDLRD